ncbi:MAG: sigma-70 family RNA polymerase sigma factor [Acidobacteriota bacterium]
MTTSSGERRDREEVEALVARIRAGEPRAEAEMVERYSRGVRFLLRHLTRDLTRADDLHQETFRLVIEKVRAGQLREPAALPGFIRQLARNLFIAEVRATAKRPADALDSMPAPEDHRPNPLAHTLARENAGIVRRLLASLEPERDRQILFRLFIAEHSREQICADLGLESLQFNRVLHRARQRLKKSLERYHRRQHPSGGGDPTTSAPQRTGEA